MAFKPDKRCKVCKHIAQGDEKLLRRLYNCSKFVKGGEAVSHIQKEYTAKYKGDPSRQFSLMSLTNHLKYHQSVDDFGLARNHAGRVESKVVENYQSVQDELISLGMDKIRSGDVDIKAKDVISLTKQKQDFELKQQDRQDAFMKMLFSFAARESQLQLTPEERLVLDADTTEPVLNSPAR